MLFSTKAEYGVRLMVELGRDRRGEPLPLATIAEAENLPLSYMEHLVAKLKRAGLVDSTRGARGGYSLGREATGITMLDVVEALEGPIVPMECFEPEPKGRVQCSHLAPGDGPCATKMLWTRVQGGITEALRETTLSDMVDFADAGSPKRQPVGGTA